MARDLLRFDPIAELSHLQKQLFGSDLLAPLRGADMPAMDVYTDDDSTLTVEAHLPDFERSDITIDLDDDAVVIQAERQEQEEDRMRRYPVRETPRSVYRRIHLPEQADAQHITAEFVDGVLTLTVPLAAGPRSKRIEIGTPAAA